MKKNLSNDNDNPLISVCITSYNHERYLRTCIDSALAQTYQNVEISVIDDCSTDSSIEILRSYGDKINLTVRDKNRGVAGYCGTINDGIRDCRGKFFYRLDSDDFLQPDYFERLIAEYKTDPTLDWLCGGLNVVNAGGEIQDSWDYATWPTDPDRALARGWQSCSVLMPHNGLLRASFLRDNDLYWRNFKYGWGADVLFTIRAMQCRPNIRLIPTPGFNWRTHGDNNSCDIVRRIELALAVKEYYIENIPSKIWLDHPLLKQIPAGSEDHEAAKFFLIAADLYRTKINFRVPTMFETETTRSELDDNLFRFDAAIRGYCERSLHCSRKYAAEIEALLERLRIDDRVSEGQRKLKLGDFGQASVKFLQVLRSDPKSVGALCGAAEAAYHLDNLEAASRFSLQALKEAPNDSQTLNNAGVILFAQGEFLPAERAIKKALTVDPQGADSHLNLLQLYGHFTRKTAPVPERTPATVRSTRWLSENSADNSRLKLMRENHQLRDTLLRHYANCAADSHERILLHRPGNGALKYLMDSWAETLNFMGIKTELLNWGEKTAQKLNDFRPTLFVTVADPAWETELDVDALKTYRSHHGLQVAHITTLDHKYDPCDFYITFHLDPTRDQRFDQLELPLVPLPFAINPLQHFMRPGREIWDFFFVGTNSHLKIGPTNRYLMPIVDNYEGILAGANWPVGIGELAVDDAAYLYNFARIYPNFHLEANFTAYNELCERTFIIPACGGFELADNPVAMKELFAPDEMAVADSPAEYAEKFAYYLRHPEKRLEFTRKGMQRVYRDYTLFHVMSRLTEQLGIKSRPAAIATNGPLQAVEF